MVASGCLSCEGFIPAVFLARVSLSVTYPHVFDDGGDSWKFKKRTRAVSAQTEPRLDLYATLLFFWDFWSDAFNFAILGMDFAIYRQSLIALKDRVFVSCWG